MLKMDQAVYDMKYINDFYIRVIEFILRVFKWAVSTNDSAHAIFIAFQESPAIKKKIAYSMAHRFSDVAQDDQLIWYFYYASIRM